MRLVPNESQALRTLELSSDSPCKRSILPLARWDQTKENKSPWYIKHIHKSLSVSDVRRLIKPPFSLKSPPPIQVPQPHGVAPAFTIFGCPPPPSPASEPFFILMPPQRWNSINVRLPAGPRLWSDHTFRARNYVKAPKLMKCHSTWDRPSFT